MDGERFGGLAADAPWVRGRLPTATVTWANCMWMLAALGVAGRALPESEVAAANAPGPRGGLGLPTAVWPLGGGGCGGPQAGEGWPSAASARSATGRGHLGHGAGLAFAVAPWATPTIRTACSGAPCRATCWPIAPGCRLVCAPPAPRHWSARWANKAPGSTSVIRSANAAPRYVVGTRAGREAPGIRMPSQLSIALCATRSG